MYATGQGAQRDLFEAHDWLTRAAAGGIPGATPYLKKVTARMSAAELELLAV